MNWCSQLEYYKWSQDELRYTSWSIRSVGIDPFGLRAGIKDGQILTSETEPTFVNYKEVLEMTAAREAEGQGDEMESEQTASMIGKKMKESQNQQSSFSYFSAKFIV